MRAASPDKRGPATAKGDVKASITLAIGDVGGGHRSAACVLTEAFQACYGDRFTLTTVDFFSLADPSPLKDSNRSQTLFSRNPLLKRLVNDPVWHLGNTGAGYRLLERYLLERTFEPYRAFLSRRPPDLLVSLHPYLSVTLSALKRRGLPGRYAVVVTDLTSLLRGWADPEADLIVSPTAESTRALERYGIDRDRIVSPLFPIATGLAEAAPREKTLQVLGLEAQKTTILLTSGGNGTGLLKEPIARLARDSRFQLIVVCGKDETLRAELSERYAGAPNLRVLGFVTTMPDLFAAADIVVGKPGPATILELELLGKSAVLTADIGPQEAGNLTYALENPRFRYVGHDWRSLESSLEGLLALPATSQDRPRRRFDEAHLIAVKLAALLD